MFTRSAVPLRTRKTQCCRLGSCPHLPQATCLSALVPRDNCHLDIFLRASCKEGTSKDALSHPVDLTLIHRKVSSLEPSHPLPSTTFRQRFRVFLDAHDLRHFHELTARWGPHLQESPHSFRKEGLKDFLALQYLLRHHSGSTSLKALPHCCSILDQRRLLSLRRYLYWYLHFLYNHHPLELHRRRFTDPFEHFLRSFPHLLSWKRRHLSPSLTEPCTLFARTSSHLSSFLILPETVYVQRSRCRGQKKAYASVP